MVLNGESQLVESDPTVACFLAPQVDEFLIPSIENAVNFNVEYLPPQFLSVVLPVSNILLSLLDVLENPVIKGIILG